MHEFVDLKRKLTKDQRSLLTEMWTHYLETDQWILGRKLRYLYRNLGREGVESALQNPLGGTVVHKATENGLDKYRPTILGVLLSERGEEAEHLLARYLGYVRDEFQRDPDITQIKSGDAEAALSLTKQESRLLWELFLLGGAWIGSASGNRDGWSAGLPCDVEDLVTGIDLGAYIRSKAMEGYDPDLPIDEVDRLKFPWGRGAKGAFPAAMQDTEEGEQGSETPRLLDPDEAARLLGEKHWLPPDSLRIYCRFWQLETWLREMAYVELKSAYGVAWTDRLKRFEHHKEKDKLLTHMTTPDESPLAYHTLSGLWAVMANEEHWPLFQGYFPPRSLADAKLQELFQIRHRVAHFRHPHSDDLTRVEQFIRDVDQSFWRFVTSYNRLEPITPAISDPVAQQFIEYDQYPWVEVEPNTWARLGRKERDAVLTLRVEYSIRPWVDKAKLSRPIAPNRGVLYDVEFQALDTQVLDFEQILEQTRRLHSRCIHIIIEALSGVIRLTIPSVLPVESVNETIQEFLEITRRRISILPRVDNDKAERIAGKWPEYVLGPRNPLAFLCHDMPCKFFEV